MEKGGKERGGNRSEEMREEGRESVKIGGDGKEGRKGKVEGMKRREGKGNGRRKGRERERQGDGNRTRLRLLHTLIYGLLNSTMSDVILYSFSADDKISTDIERRAVPLLCHLCVCKRLLMILSAVFQQTDPVHSLLQTKKS